MNVPSEFLLLSIIVEVEADDRFELDPRWSDTGDRYVLFLSSLQLNLYQRQSPHRCRPGQADCVDTS